MNSFGYSYKYTYKHINLTQSTCKQHLKSFANFYQTASQRVNCFMIWRVDRKLLSDTKLPKNPACFLDSLYPECGSFGPQEKQTYMKDVYVCVSRATDPEYKTCRGHFLLTAQRNLDFIIGGNMDPPHRYPHSLRENRHSQDS